MPHTATLSTDDERRTARRIVNEALDRGESVHAAYHRATEWAAAERKRRAELLRVIR